MTAMIEVAFQRLEVCVLAAEQIRDNPDQRLNEGLADLIIFNLLMFCKERREDEK